jgi:hypothetical protein
MPTIDEEIRWMKDHPGFRERPASMREFLGAKYLNIAKKVRPGVTEALEDIFGRGIPDGIKIAKVQAAMFTGAIGIGKTTLASIALPYMVHWVLCLEDPQGFYDLLPGSRIAFMMMSTSEQQAREVIFGDIKARIDGSPWFQANWKYDPKYTKSIRFPSDIWILPGDSAETTFEGYNILGGVLDEADSHKATKEKDYAEQGYNTIESRIESRYVDNSDPSHVGHKGLIIVIGQMKKANGFAAKKYKELLEDPYAKVIRMTIWESFGWDKYTNADGTRNSFWYDIDRRQILPDEIGKEVQARDKVIEIPRAFFRQFKINPEKALKDLAGIPPTAEDPFISMPYKLDDAEARWVMRYGDIRPVNDSCVQPTLAEWLGRRDNIDARKRVAHIDIGYSAEGDAAGIAVGHVRELVESEEGDLRPYIVMDALIRFKAPIGGQVMLSDLRRVIYMLKDRGMRIDKVTLDGFESTDTRQQFVKRRLRVGYISLDKDKVGYEDLREAIYEDRIEWPPYETYLSPGSSTRIKILNTELLGLSDDGRKIDHPKDGSKDLSDAVAGVVTTLMGDKTYRKGLSSTSKTSQGEGNPQKTMEELLSRFDRTQSASPFGDIIPPGGGPTTSTNTLGIIVPDRLRPH